MAPKFCLEFSIFARMFYKPAALILLVCLAASCKRNDDISPVVLLNADTIEVHYRGMPYTDPGVETADNYTCNLTDIEVTNTVDTGSYGSYTVSYRVTDDAGNITEITRPVDIVLPVSDYYSLDYDAVDTCTSNNYFYTGLIQDCNCDELLITVANLSNFGLSAVFDIPLSGQYYEYLMLDTIKSGVHFEGFGIMTPGADSIKWEYSISDSISTDVCKSTWVKQ